MPEETTPLPAARIEQTTDHRNVDLTHSLAPAGNSSQACAIEEPPGYRLLGEIGRGGMGVVYRAYDEALEREVAVKLLHDRYLGESDGSSAVTQRFISEAKITARLQHPGIPAVYQVGRCASGRPFLAMKLIRGETLDKLLAAQSALNTLAVFEAICQAVGYAHAQQVIHRDLKPSNIMVGSFGEVQVMDWGLAKKFSRSTATEDLPGPAAVDLPNGQEAGSLTQDGSIIGTLAFMPPEQARGEVAKIDERADVFGLGAILCVLLTGHPPFTGKDWHSIRLAAVLGDLSEARERLANCGAEPELVALCRRCLATEFVDRPRNAQAVALEVAALRQAAEERARRAESERVRAEVFAVEQRKRRTLAYLGSGVLCGVLLIGIIGTTVGMLRASAAQRAEAQRAIAESKAKQLANEQRIKAEEQRVRAEEQQAQAELARDSARSRYLLALEAFDQMVNGVQLRLMNRADTHELRIELLKSARTGVQKLVADGEAAEKPDFTLGWSYLRMGDVELNLGNTAAAEVEFQKALAVAERLAAENPSDREAQQNLNVSLQRLGNVQLKAGQTQSALRLLERALANSRELFADSQDEISSRRLAQALIYVGDAHLQAGQLAEALKSYQEKLEIDLHLASSQPKDAHSQFELGVAHERLGNIHLAMGKRTEALAQYEKALAISERLHRAAPQNIDYERALFVSWDHLGRAHDALGDKPLAKAAYGRALDICRRLAEGDPRNVLVQRDLSIVLERLGTLSLHAGQVDAGIKLLEQSLEVRQRLAKDDPRSSEAQRDLATAYERLGTSQLHLNDARAAQPYFERQHEILQRLAVEDPQDSFTQRALALSLSHLGVTARKQLQFAAAEAFHRQQRELAEQMLAADPESIAAQIEISRAQFHLGELLLSQSDFGAAKELFLQCQTSLLALNATNHLQADEQSWLQSIPRRLHDCELGEKAIADINVALNQPPIIVASVLTMRLNGLLRLQRYEEAIATADRHAAWAREQKSDPAMELYLAYRGYAFCALAIPPDEREPLIRKALETIMEAKEKGFFPNRKNLFFKDVQFKPVWEHELFRPLMREIGVSQTK